MSKFKSIIFYIVSFTWGIIMSLIGLLACLGLLITGHKPHKFHERLYFQVGKSWGGVDLGPFFITDSSPTLHVKQHESGHGFQNCWWGPLMPFVVCLPSAIRYWLRECKTKKGKIIYSTIISLIFLIIGAGCFVPGIIFDILWLIIIGGLILIYFIFIFSWLFFSELPQYGDKGNYSKENKYVDYDSAWFEGQASSLGAKIYPKE